MIHVALDDTDSREGMCTTWMVGRILERLRGVDLIGPPRIVRLNPNIPWKTRGNGAVVLTLGRGEGPPSGVAFWSRRRGAVPFFSRSKSEGLPRPEEILEEVVDLVETYARCDSPGTQPGIVVSRSRPPCDLYRRAVQGIVSKEEATLALCEVGALFVGLRGGRGLIGASSALAFEPIDRTFEILAYRPPSRWGRPRIVQGSSLLRIEEEFPSVFDSFDRETAQPVGIPSSPCPVLLGIRSEDPSILPEALSRVESEPWEEWTLFETNQATDDHLQPYEGGGIHPWVSLKVRLTIEGEPLRRGGHVFVRGTTETGEGLLVAAFAPTGSFRRVVSELREGDEVLAAGGVHDRGWGPCLGLEKIRILSLSPRKGKGPNPPCPRCGKSLKSLGRGKGLRCARCPAVRLGPSRDLPLSPSLEPTSYEVPPRARRHLSKPLKRGA